MLLALSLTTLLCSHVQEREPRRREIWGRYAQWDKWPGACPCLLVRPCGDGHWGTLIHRQRDLRPRGLVTSSGGWLFSRAEHSAWPWHPEVSAVQCECPVEQPSHQGHLWAWNSRSQWEGQSRGTPSELNVCPYLPSQKEKYMWSHNPQVGCVWGWDLWGSSSGWMKS